MMKEMAILGILMATFSANNPPAPSGGSESPCARQGDKPGTIVAFGDSLTEGFGLSRSKSYPARLEARLAAEGCSFRVVNAGVSGETSRGALARIKTVLDKRPDIVILETGANDAFQGHDPEDTRRNISRIIERLKERDIVVVLAAMPKLPYIPPDYAERFAAIYPQLAREHDVILIPSFLEGVGGKADLNLPDGVHPNARGYELITENLYPYVLEAIARNNRSTVR